VVNEENVTGGMMQLESDQSRWQKTVGFIQRYPLFFTVAFLFIFPFIVPYRALATEIIIWGLFALGYNVCLGYTGMLSFGHAAYFGVGH
jgi:branched-chain amino acid transport system permease protein